MIVTGWSVNSELTDDNESLVSPRSRCKHAACLRAGVVYVFGGKDANIPLNDVWSYDIGTWKAFWCTVIFVKFPVIKPEYFCYFRCHVSHCMDVVY